MSSENTDFGQNSRNSHPSGAGLAPGNKVITLVLQKGTERKVFRLHKERLVIGTVVSADVRLIGEGVAPIHAVIELAAPGAKPDSKIEASIFDLASESGVFVNNQKIVVQELQSGDKLRIGGHELSFQVDQLASLIPKERTSSTEGRRLFMDPNEDFSPLLLEDERTIRQIFNYRPAEKRALAVVMSWRDTVLDVEHFVKEKSVTVGSTVQSDFGIPPLLGQKKFAIASRSGEDFTLNLDPKMTGVIQRKGSLASLDELRGGGGSLVLGNDDFAKVSVGEVDFYLSYTAAPPKLKMRQLFERDAFLFKVLFVSFAFTSAIIVALLNIDVTPTLEAEQIPDRIATILYQPEKYVEKPKAEPQPKETPKEEVKQVTPPPPKPTPKATPKPTPTVKVTVTPRPVKTVKPVPKEMAVAPPAVKPKPVPTAAVPKTQGSKQHQNQAKEGEGAKAKGVSGIRGSKTAAPSQVAPNQDKALRPSANGGTGAGGGKSQVADVGNVDVMKDASAKIQDILGNAGAQLGKGGERLKGFGGFTTQGNGGLALSGAGAGGGGSSDLSQGLGDKGHGGGKIGTGMGAAGSGSGIIGGKTRVALRTGGPEETVVTGSIDPDAILNAILAHKDEFRLCYEKEINAETPNIGGTVSTTFVIGSTGRVTQAGINSTTLKNSNVERCVLNVIKRIDFPIPRGAGVVQVAYPFKFASVK